MNESRRSSLRNLTIPSLRRRLKNEENKNGKQTTRARSGVRSQPAEGHPQLCILKQNHCTFSPAPALVQGACNTLRLDPFWHTK